MTTLRQKFEDQFGWRTGLEDPLEDYWVALDGLTGHLGFTWSDKPHRLVFDLLGYALYLENELKKCKS